MFMHPFNLICIYVWCVHLDSCRKVEDNLVLRCRLPDILNSSTNIQCKFYFCTGKALRGILQLDISVKFCSTLFYHFCSINGNLFNCFFIFMKNHITLKYRSRIVNMNNYILDSLNCLKRTVDQMLSALCQNLNLYIVRNHILIYQFS